MIELPDFASTEEAVQFGRFITPDQYVLLEGAKQIIDQILEDFSIEPNERVRLITKRQLIREAQEMASDLVLASLPKDEASQLEPVLTGHL